MRRLTVLTLALALAGCGHGGRPEIAAEKLPLLVLRPSDLPAAFERFDEGRLGKLDAHPGPRADEKRFGREGGWKARYKRAGSPATRGALVVESRTDIFGDADGARKDLSAYEEEFRRTGQLLPPPRLGEGAVAMTLAQGPVRFYAVGWQEHNATGSVLVNGFHVSLADALALARKQERRMSSAATG